jgi:alkanesulfonate monooxygenase SsuD/methylene tetrahydromethanopterin reductase-like flavin-dependent oxidoreductase (luciferase family)
MNIHFPSTWNSSWPNNLRLARMLDDAGIDFMLPIARWIGYGGATNFHGGVLETMTWAAALLAKTRDISVFATIHTAANHPVVVAKQLATIDQISNGRIGLNIIAGWNQPEYEALGPTLADDHVTRYGYAQEWFDIVKELWGRTESFDWEGTYFKLKNVLGDPRPSSPLPVPMKGADLRFATPTSCSRRPLICRAPRMRSPR